MTLPLVSIIVPIYKVEEYLDHCVRSITEQTYTNLEIILVDDGSPDGCPAICDTWAKKDSRIKVIHKENGGISDARNFGIDIATGEWILFIDSDDVVSVYLVESLVKANKEKNILVVAAFSRFHDELPEDYLSASAPRDCGKRLAKCRNGLYCWGALYNLELINNIILRFDVNLRNVEDVAWNSIYLRYIDLVRFIPDPMYYYRINPTSITSHCIDSEWQVASWIKTKISIMNWFADKNLTKQQLREVHQVFRHCQNNIYAECLSGRIPYKKYSQINKVEKDIVHMNESNVPYLDKALLRLFPRVYFDIYIIALRFRDFCQK